MNSTAARNRVLLEVCVDTAHGLLAAQRGGADRIELCSALALDGLTPSAGLMRRAAEIQLPVYAMIRPRDGDFVFDDEDVDVMLHDIDAARSAGLAGVVLGACLPSGELDHTILARLCDHATGMGKTLHRAVDLAPDAIEAVDTAIQLGFERILTSGGAEKAENGIERIARMAHHAAGRLSIMAGSGVTPANAALIIRKTGVRELHGSCSAAVEFGTRLSLLPSNSRETRAELVAELLAVLTHLPPEARPAGSVSEALGHR